MKSLYGKFVLFTIFIMLSSFFITFFIINTFYHQTLKVSNDDKNMNIALNIANFIENNETIELDNYLNTQANAGYKIYVVDETQEKTLYGNEFRTNNLSHKAINSVLAGQEYHGMRDLPKETFVTGIFSDELANTVGVPFKFNDKQYALFLRPDIKLLFSEIQYLLGGMFVGMAVLSLLAMLIVAKKLIKPITELTEATKKVGEEKFVYHLNINQKDEIGQLATSFQSMVRKLEEHDQLRKEFISDVSHDFQTPLQNIQGYSELLSDTTLSDDKRIQYSNVIRDETERLSSLTKQLLLLTSLDQLSAPLQISSVSLDEQLRQVVQRNRWGLEDQELSLTLELEPLTIKADPSFLENIWENLLSNAIKYTPKQGEIKILMSSKKDHVKITFEDNGIGIAKEHIPHIFERFYRADAARHRGIEGTGLGLSIAKQITELHGGKLTIDSTPKIGTTITVELPLL